MSRDIDYFNRILDNLYTAVFERPAQRFNRPIRNVLTSSDSVLVTETSLTLTPNVPAARYYSDLTIGGAWNHDETQVAGDTLQHSATALDETTMWLVLRMRPQWASGTPPTSPTIFRWQTDANNRLAVFYNSVGNLWTVSRLNAGAGASVTIAGSHASNDTVKLAVQFTATTVGLSRDGAATALTTVSNTNIPVITGTTFDIGNGDNPSTVKWDYAAMGLGSLTQADFQSIFSTLDSALPGVYVPNFTAFPLFANFDQTVFATMSLMFGWLPVTGFSEKNAPMGVYGESVYV